MSEPSLTVKDIEPEHECQMYRCHNRATKKVKVVMPKVSRIVLCCNSHERKATKDLLELSARNYE